MPKESPILLGGWIAAAVHRATRRFATDWGSLYHMHASIDCLQNLLSNAKHPGFWCFLKLGKNELVYSDAIAMAGARVYQAISGSEMPAPIRWSGMTVKDGASNHETICHCRRSDARQRPSFKR